MGDKAPLIIEVSDSSAGVEISGKYTTYEQFLSSGDKKFKWWMPEDEWEDNGLPENFTDKYHEEEGDERDEVAAGEGGGE